MTSVAMGNASSNDGNRHEGETAIGEADFLGMTTDTAASQSDLVNKNLSPVSVAMPILSGDSAAAGGDAKRPMPPSLVAGEKYSGELNGYKAPDGVVESYALEGPSALKDIPSTPGLPSNPHQESREEGNDGSLNGAHTEHFDPVSTQEVRRAKKKSTSRISKSNNDVLGVVEEETASPHAQALLLGMCFLVIWTPNNVLAPNLTQAASYFNMTDEERDTYLGSFLALDTLVASFPLSALIGFATDFCSRKFLFIVCAFGGAIAALATGLSTTYGMLLVGRFFSGGFMSGSTPVAFSLLGDLFTTGERNAASSALTAMMGAGIIIGQVYSGMAGPIWGWQNGFYFSAVLQIILGVCVVIWVVEPIRGGKEPVVQDLLRHGKQYDRKITWKSFWDAMTKNATNFLTIIQGFFTGVPWGIIFVFLNDYLSQERGFSVTGATFIVAIFGVGCAIGGIVGGVFGQWVQSYNVVYLPVLMGTCTGLAILPFLALLNGTTTDAEGFWAILYSLTAGIISSIPAVNVRPCIINVNPPETRGATLTAANLVINIARGIGPSFITIMALFGYDRQSAFNIAIIVFWTICMLQLFALMKYLPEDQRRMEEELAAYAHGVIGGLDNPSSLINESEPFLDQAPESSRSLDESVVSIDDRITSFDQIAARESITFIKKGMEEIHLREMLQRNVFPCSPGLQGASSDEFDDLLMDENAASEAPSERTPLI